MWRALQLRNEKKNFFHLNTLKAYRNVKGLLPIIEYQPICSFKIFSIGREYLVQFRWQAKDALAFLNSYIWKVPIHLLLFLFSQKYIEKTVLLSQYKNKLKCERLNLYHEIPNTFFFVKYTQNHTMICAVQFSWKMEAVSVFLFLHLQSSKFTAATLLVKNRSIVSAERLNWNVKGLRCRWFLLKIGTIS